MASKILEACHTFLPSMPCRQHSLDEAGQTLHAKRIRPGTAGRGSLPQDPDPLCSIGLLCRFRFSKWPPCSCAYCLQKARRDCVDRTRTFWNHSKRQVLASCFASRSAQSSQIHSPVSRLYRHPARLKSNACLSPSAISLPHFLQVQVHNHFTWDLPCTSRRPSTSPQPANRPSCASCTLPHTASPPQRPAQSATSGKRTHFSRGTSLSQ